MNSTTRFAAISTKVRALFGRLLNDDDYIYLLSENDITGIAAYLKHKTHYHKMLSNIDESEIHRGELENLLKKRHIDDLYKVIHFFHDEYREFYRTLFMRYEIEDLKVIARRIKTKNDVSVSNISLIYIGKFSKLDTNILLTSKDIISLVNNLKETVYYKHLRPLVEGKDRVNFFSFEMALDLAYFDMFYNRLNKISPRDRELIEKYQGIKVDLLNVQWIYRGLKFYAISAEELFNYTIDYGFEFNRNDIKKLCYVGSLDEFQNIILNTEYNFLFDQENTKDIFMERRILRYQYFKLKRIKEISDMSISIAFVYSLLSEVEIRDIISIIESTRYGIEVDEAKKYLIRKL